MKYINNQNNTCCINLYNINYFYIKELSLYAQVGKKKIQLGTFNTKEDAQSEYNNILSIIDDSSQNKKVVYKVNAESYWIQKRVESEIQDIWDNTLYNDSYVITDYEHEDDFDDFDYDAAYVKEHEEDMLSSDTEDTEQNDDISTDELENL